MADDLERALAVERRATVERIRATVLELWPDSWDEIPPSELLAILDEVAE